MAPGNYIRMAGSEVFKLAVTMLGRIVDEALEANQLDKSAINWLVPHQANIRIIQATAKKLDMPMERVIVTVQEHGNTSAASVPLEKKPNRLRSPGVIAASRSISSTRISAGSARSHRIAAR